MTKDDKKTIQLSIILIGILFGVFLLALIAGRYPISLQAMFEIIKGNHSSYPVEVSIIKNLRLPRTIIALLVGISLSISGLIYQEVFRNKLVSPDFLGVSSGASVGAALAIIMGLSAWYISMFAFVLGISAMLLTIFFANIINKQSPTILVLSGIVVSSLMSAIISIIKYLAPSEIILADITFWLMGSFANAKYNAVYMLLPIVLIGTVTLYLMRWKINIIGQGMFEAQSQGLNYKRYLILVIVIATFLTATSVSFAGVIGWVGLVVPHIIRFFVGKNTKHTIPLTILFGAIFTIIADVLSRTFTGSEIPLSAITGLLGTLIFGVTLYVNRRQNYELN
ncbi:FecCD family ABC transporter permease [Paracholeplasma manati]|uniref:FecCD family ABC transporter permease n=1 Tax=Paracholeplasma manati TaxID=591373 RepID=UPI00240778C0|nr:iron ABC transporter permease [Paracholeplasma manati]MDG0889178.1 iron ABC transporter permease [Paracholeplasma manati]